VESFFCLVNVKNQLRVICNINCESVILHVVRLVQWIVSLLRAIYAILAYIGYQEGLWFAIDVNVV
jgi:hypothetical protein